MKYFTKKWYSACQNSPQLSFRTTEKDISQKTIDEYNKYYEKIKSSLPDGVKNLNMHDCRIVHNTYIGKDIHLVLDSKDAFCSVDKIIFVNAEIVICDVVLDNAWWLYEEIYLNTDGYEMHVLLSSEKGDIGELIIRFSDVVITS